MIYSVIYASPIGRIKIQSDGHFITHIYLDNEVDDVKTIENNDLDVFKKAKQWLDGYFKGENPSVQSLPLKPIGTDFQHAVWNLLLEIPYGVLTTYKDLAEKIADSKKIKRMSAQAIGGAVGSNPISIIIPCHRVIGQKRNLTGYAGGIDKKIALLKLEGHDIQTFKLP